MAFFNPIKWLLGLLSQDLGIDLGTANTLVNVRGKGIVINEPSWVAIDKRTREPLKIGAAAKAMVGRTPANMVTLRPLRDGVISEYDITQALLEYFISKAHENSIVLFPHSRVVIGIPSGATEVEKRAVYDAAMSAGARETYMILEPAAAAIGAGLPIDLDSGNMIVDIGGGTTEVAVISTGGIVISRSLRVAGDELDQDIIEYVRSKYNLYIGEQMAEKVKIAIGSSSIEIRDALSPSVQVIVDTIKDALDESPPEILSDLMDNGICLAGGTAQLQGLAERLSNEVRVRVWVAEDPMTCVARGCGMVLDDMDLYENLLVGIERDPYTNSQG